MTVEKWIVGALAVAFTGSILWVFCRRPAGAEAGTGGTPVTQAPLESAPATAPEPSPRGSAEPAPVHSRPRAERKVTTAKSPRSRTTPIRSAPGRRKPTSSRRHRTVVRHAHPRPSPKPSARA
jgi:hypothetical protein